MFTVLTVFTSHETFLVEYSSYKQGDIQADKKPTYEQLVDVKLGEEALAAVGGPTKIGNCGD